MINYAMSTNEKCNYIMKYSSCDVLSEIHFLQSYFHLMYYQKEEGQSDMPVTHDSMRLIEQVKTVCEHRIYLDEAKELYSLISSKWLHVSKY